MRATAAGKPRRTPRFLVPEVVQTSTMDCGPASLKCMLEGFGIDVSYGRLREACQTSVDGTSIDTVEEVAKALGLDAEQVILPIDHALLPESKALPAIIVVALPIGATHFIVVWKRYGGFLQIMDPGTGRRWVREAALLRELYRHEMSLPAPMWRAWADSRTFINAFVRRVQDLGIPKERARGVLAQALSDPTHKSMGLLDASVRMVASAVRSGGLRKGDEAERAIHALYKKAATGSLVIPPGFWSVRPSGGLDDDGEELLTVRGVVLVKARTEAEDDGDGESAQAGADDVDLEPDDEAVALTPELTAALNERPAEPLRALFKMLREDGIAAPAFVGAGLAVAAAGALVEAVLFRGMFDVGQHLLPGAQRASAVVALAIFVACVALLELPIASALMRLGRHLEARVRVAYLTKLPRLGDQYFHSRLASDMAERSHVLHVMRRVPELGARLMRATFGLLVTTLGITWLDPASAPVAAAIAVLAVVLPLVFQPLMAERDLRVRTHEGALTRFYLDALLGLVPIRAHAAERSVRREHEGLLVDWLAAGYSLQRSAVLVDGLLAIFSLGLATWLLAHHLGSAREVGSVLLLVYWTLQLPALGEDVASGARQYPALRNVTLRVLELLGATEETEQVDAVVRAPTPSLSTTGPRRTRGMGVRLEGVQARAGGHTILEGIDLDIAPGSHIAIVGSSGAGKSSLVGLLLGWMRPAEGRILVDGVPLEGADLARLRAETAWVDPSVHLWNKSFLDNLVYGAPAGAIPPIGHVVATADLHGVLERMPDGLQTSLGEGGGLVSGGEGQRVRLGRALVKTGARLVILDEPFRGLDREQRRSLLARAREVWKDATLLCITHDVGETLGFTRVLVIDEGRLVEDSEPGELLARPTSRYLALLRAEEHVRANMWGGTGWRRLRIAKGTIVESPRDADAGKPS